MSEHEPLSPTSEPSLSLPQTTESKDRKLLGTGRRKTAVARVCLIYGSGQFRVNGRSGDAYLQATPTHTQSARAPLRRLGVEARYDVIVKAHGGGVAAQAQAISLGVARALCHASPGNKQLLRRSGFLTRDARAKERKKYGLKKARKSSQFTKR